ncbi:hypothetical protein L873DRAFT_1824559 [Choiromyces venosus 120613-1]|uniref:Uncharacterized protein n=1 Tax=Choiromyces venosus 120613-1 TaxID=1336337 RepID=A0A3N4IVR8_9PEZI|nr:hypothetical protein L873DRAFT_1824559 [Choiromyces venosus 120613-1]
MPVFSENVFMYQIRHPLLAFATKPVSRFDFKRVMSAHFQIPLFPCRHHTDHL